MALAWPADYADTLQQSADLNELRQEFELQQAHVNAALAHGGLTEQIASLPAPDDVARWQKHLDDSLSRVNGMATATAPTPQQPPAVTLQPDMTTSNAREDRAQGQYTVANGYGWQKDVGGLVPAQYDDASLSAAAANAACGPAAAVAFAKANGRNPTLSEAVQLAQQVGWSPDAGMSGAASEQALMQRMGVKTRLDAQPNWQSIQTDAAGGNPVTISTPQHYFVVDGYDPRSGTYHVGNSGTAVQSLGGSEWMTPGQIATVGRGINGVLYVDHPLASGPSVTE